jgi:hypothetical protein
VRLRLRGCVRVCRLVALCGRARRHASRNQPLHRLKWRSAVDFHSTLEACDLRAPGCSPTQTTLSLFCVQAFLVLRRLAAAPVANVIVNRWPLYIIYRHVSPGRHHDEGGGRVWLTDRM